jgi:uncharacterized protein (TIGR04255 family)
MDWEPAHADHSIDQVIVMATIDPALDPDTFDEMVVSVRRLANAHGFTDRSEQQEAIFAPPVAPGQSFVISVGNEVSTRRRVTYRQIAAGIVVGEFSIGATSVSLSTSTYRRWANFSATFVELFNSLEASARILSRIKSVRLQYLDRFRSMPGGADHFEVLSRNSPFIVDSLRSAGAAFHVHSGWFDLSESNVRKLTNVNIDVSDLSGPAPPDMRRQLTILCLGQDEALTGILSDPIERIQSLHLYLKDLFGNTISPEAAARVALNLDSNGSHS